jgi:hypothetical protein
MCDEASTVLSSVLRAVAADFLFYCWCLEYTSFEQEVGVK